MAFAYDGAWAEYTVAQAVGLTRVPDNVPLEQAAILADAVSTPFGAVVRTGQVGIGESVGVWGVGGVGTRIVQLARLVGAAPIIAVDIKPAVWTGRSGWAPTTRWTRAIPGCGTRSPRSPAADCWMWRSTHVLGHLGYQNVDIEALATLVSLGRLDLSRSISDIVSLEDISAGVEKLERQDGNPIRILVKL